MSQYERQNRALRVTTALDKDALLLVGLQAKETISELYELQLELLSPANTPIDFSQVLGQPVGVVIDQEIIPPRFLHGIAVELEQGRSDESFTQFRMVVRPRMWWLTRHHRSRIFQQLSAVEILKIVLGRPMNDSSSS